MARKRYTHTHTEGYTPAVTCPARKAFQRAQGSADTQHSEEEGKKKISENYYVSGER